jgi:hypothetical protein
MVTGTGSLIASSATIYVGPESLGLLSRARGLLHGVNVLATTSDDTTTACHFLAAWTLELLLKSYLSHTGLTKAQLRPIQHNLEALWAKASSLGLSVASIPPRWCQLLNGIHDAPYHSRYPTNAAAYIGPGLRTLNTELEAVFTAVEKVVQPG